MSDFYEEIRKFAEREKAEAEKAIQTEENQVCIKADSYVAKEIKYQTALLHQILNKLNETSCTEKKKRERGEVLAEIEELNRQIRYEHPELAAHMKKQMLDMGKGKTGDKQTHLNRYYAWRIIEAIATPPPKERRRLSSKEYAKISRKEIKEIFKYTISLLEKMGINSLDDVKF